MGPRLFWLEFKGPLGLEKMVACHPGGGVWLILASGGFLPENTHFRSIKRIERKLPENLGNEANRCFIWVFPKIGVPQNGWFIMEIPIKLDDLGVPPFSETPICFTGDFIDLPFQWMGWIFFAMQIWQFLIVFFLWTRSTPCFFHRGFVLLQEKTDDLLEAPTCPLGTVDGSEILHQLRLVVYPIIYRAFFIPGVFFWDFFHQQ